jgi:hypothetical protein
MKLTVVFAIAATLCAATQASAQEKKFAGYVIKAKTETVEGVLLVDGYTPAELVAFMREDCASGEIGGLSYVGKPYKKRGNTFQKFRTTCVGGPSPRIGQTSAVAVEIERMPDGRNMTEYTYGVSGDIKYTQYIR